MKAYQVNKVNKKYWDSIPIREIEVDRVTDKSYFDHRGRSALDTEYHRVLTDLQAAVDYAIDLANKDIQELERQRQAILDRVNKVHEFKNKAGAE